MMMSPEEVLAAISKSLIEQVLPHLEPANWVTSSVRSSAMLLIYLEDRVAMEPVILVQSIALIRGFLSEIADMGDVLPLTEAARDLISTNLTTDVEGFSVTSVSELRILIEELKYTMEGVSGYIRSIGDAHLRSKLHDCLNSLENIESPLTIRANDYVPL
jgi:hypothetical protein